ncbi:hypothetical protein [Mycolicibacterium sediminis]|uniref:Uncharacterized protein n=1 Tax=Mycolicibacterium sediminis TaxID=1286180 RepID=A0A7I7QZY5_9MYCO|nr:hypothetical protein [Mycolicibacterium sediminis]BBY31865.1 hypothetical protein MSEDJ_59610 [Mycolicibacterium sediminis]
MAESLLLRGIELRYVLTNHLARHGDRTVAELVVVLEHLGFGVSGRPSKAVSDALRWEVRLGRVYKRGRTIYGPGYLPRATEWRIDRRVAELRERALPHRPQDSSTAPDWLFE